MNNGFKTFYPGRYSELDGRPLKELLDRYDAIKNRKPLDIRALCSETLDRDYPGREERVIRITEDGMRHAAEVYDSENRLYFDEEYAKSLGYEGCPAFPMLITPDFMDAMPAGAGDFMVVSGFNHFINYAKPVYAGDTIYSVVDDA